MESVLVNFGMPIMIIRTRDVNDYSESPVHALTPREFLERR